MRLHRTFRKVFFFFHLFEEESKLLLQVLEGVFVDKLYFACYRSVSSPKTFLEVIMLSVRTKYKRSSRVSLLIGHVYYSFTI